MKKRLLVQNTGAKFLEMFFCIQVASYMVDIFWKVYVVLFYV